MIAEIRGETPSDIPAIRRLNAEAFGGDFEGRLVDMLRADTLFVASLVAADGSTLVGHILFSRITIESPDRRSNAVALAPMAVLPGHQRRGIGSALVRRGLDECRSQGERIVFVVGHPSYYPRFGFSAARAGQLSSPYAGDALMALELEPGALDGVIGAVVYPPAFGSGH